MTRTTTWLLTAATTLGAQEKYKLLPTAGVWSERG